MKIVGYRRPPPFDSIPPEFEPADTPEKRSKAVLVMAIGSVLRGKGWQLCDAETALGVPGLERILRGYFAEVTEMQLREILTAAHAMPSRHGNRR